MFQFYLSSIKRADVGICRTVKIKFQFYLSSIKRKGFLKEHYCNGMFQFYLSSIKRLMLFLTDDTSKSFNSTLVQLKVLSDSLR